MKNLTIPRLYCPFSSVLNPHTDAVKQHTDQWVIKFGLCFKEDFERYNANNYSAFTARFYPNADYDQLCIASDLVALLFIVDDHIDSQFAESAVEKEFALRQFIEKFMTVINPKIELQTTQQFENPVFIALADVWSRLICISRDEWIRSFVKEIEYIFAAAIWEYQNSFKQLPGVEEYLEKRRYAGAANVSLALIQPIEKNYLPEFAKNHVIIQKLSEAACNAICISNDLFSLSKEQLSGDKHNLPSIIKNEQNVTWEEAVLLTAEIHDTEVNKFIALSKELPSFDEETDQILKRYTNILELQMAGNIAWSESETARYPFTYASVVS
ncbi:hypothetical protein QFZ37_000470 [Chryseobacterium ginsenosidimutans]|uniref:terpene synthase family protein n=1 Tax=Chryseobacterium ginsenosidimutans TaxID=687846 RepID=UPI002788B225|nr:hypothetical protein [Chryseobacterium ginsenosidimutans]MDQ0592101.1 hypothetical protein [Chryseobacterium ginsenosidimutans]